MILARKMKKIQKKKIILFKKRKYIFTYLITGLFFIIYYINNYKTHGDSYLKAHLLHP